MCFEEYNQYKNRVLHSIGYAVSRSKHERFQHSITITLKNLTDCTEPDTSFDICYAKVNDFRQKISSMCSSSSSMSNRDTQCFSDLTKPDEQVRWYNGTKRISLMSKSRD